MELLLTPVVNRILSKFVRKIGDGTSGSQLRARLSGGSVVLHNLELNLDRLTGSASHFRDVVLIKYSLSWHIKRYLCLDVSDMDACGACEANLICHADAVPS
jgi:hypothetical protein